MQYIVGSEIKTNKSEVDVGMTTKTKFKVGDKVRATKKSNGQYGTTTEQNGWTGVIISVDTDAIFEADTLTPIDECSYGGLDPKYFELLEPKPTKNQRLTSAEQAITTLEQKVEAMQAEIDTLKATQKTPVTTIADAIKRYSEHTPNEQRKAIIDEAKAFVEATLAEVDEQMGWQTTKIRTYKEYGRLRIEFIVNAEERTVVALARLGNIPNLEDVLGKGIAKCAPGDVFNADIGKAIALGRALGLDVSKFEKAVQPSEVVTGMHVDTYYIGSDEKNETCPTFVTHVLNGMPAFDNGTHSSVFKITDDTEAQY